MDVAEAVRTRLELKAYSDDPVDDDTREAILDAGRLAPSGRNRQHWRFVVLTEQADLDRLAELSPSGRWIDGVDFAVVVCTDPEYSYHEIDAGRAVTHMQLVAWEAGIASRIYTVDRPEVYEFLEVPDGYHLTLVAGFGYPEREVRGMKDREPLEEVAFDGRFGRPLESG